MQAEEKSGTGEIKTPVCVICGNRAVWVQNGKGICRECVNQAQTQKAAEVAEVERQDNDYLRSMAEMCIRICKNTSGDETVERIVILFGSIERNATIAERARIARIEKAYQRDVASLDNRENGARAERARIVAALNARKQTATISEERAKHSYSNTLISYYEGELNAIDDAIDIAREEG